MDIHKDKIVAYINGSSFDKEKRTFNIYGWAILIWFSFQPYFITHHVVIESNLEYIGERFGALEDFAYFKVMVDSEKVENSLSKT